MQEKAEHLFQVYVDRVVEASACKDRGLVEGWASDMRFDLPDLVPEFAGMTLQQVQEVDLAWVVADVNGMWDEVS